MITILILIAMTMQNEPIRVYVYAARGTDGFVDDESTRRSDTVADIKNFMSGRPSKWRVSLKNKYQLVELPASAQITLEVTTSAKTPAGTESTTRGGMWPGTLKTETEVVQLPTVAVTMRVAGAEYSTEFKAQEQAFWRDLARDVVNKFDEWVTKNRGKFQ